ncbi:hypothetical protein HB770_10480 [Rhizobium leguminosarum bv. viciae]|uniref:Uncharacterized protein n=1 Tax=Rhizobium leguminosarum bv. viciae TaxID=387 RepID=A0A7G6RJ59_RHILV|nr:hypothetical protein HB770_10480 [Rhizobium leguminosarum bv. viciae]
MRNIRHDLGQRGIGLDLAFDGGGDEIETGIGPEILQLFLDLDEFFGLGGLIRCDHLIMAIELGGEAKRR